jgi:hypothetical protein
MLGNRLAMSQPDDPYGSPAFIDPILLGMEQQGFGDEYFGQGMVALDASTAEFPGAGGLLEADYFDSAGYQTPSTHSTPDLSTYNGGYQTSSTYSTPGPTTPTPYPLDQHPQLQPFAHRQQQKPQHIYVHPHGHTQTSNPDNRHAYSRANPPLHHRSLSHGDVDRMTHPPQEDHAPTPTFFRLAAPNSRIATPIEAPAQRPKKRQTPYLRGSNARSASQGPGHSRTRSRATTPANLLVESNTLDAIGLCIGTPMDSRLEVKEPLLVEMEYEDQVRLSRRVIEVGAMAVLNAPRAKNDTAQSSPTNNTEKNTNRSSSLINKVDEIERYLKENGVEADQSCGMIRKALSKDPRAQTDETIQSTKHSKDRAADTGLGSQDSHGLASDGTIDPRLVYLKQESELEILDTGDEFEKATRASN